MIVITNKNSTIAIFGISDNKERYSYLAYKKLLDNNFKNLIGVSLKEISLSDIALVKNLSDITKPIHTLTVYISAVRLESLVEEIISLAPQRIILNPGTENKELIKKAKENKIEVIEGCTLVMLNTEQF